MQFPTMLSVGSIGQLRERVTIEQPTRTTDTGGWATDSWSHLATSIPAKVEPLTGRELFQAQAVTATLSHRVTIRYRTDVLPKMRIVWGGLTLEIQSIANSGARDRFSVLECGLAQ